jgi:hypothetical protein
VLYALFEYNGFPKWLAELPYTHSYLFAEGMSEPLAAEFDGYTGTFCRT